jgi:DNA-binding TFAR19-related protein (PDSD5 family)
MAKNASQAREDISDKIIFDIPVSVDAEFSSALRTVLVEASTASWEFWFGLLEQFKEAEGHCRVPKGLKLDGFNFGNWVGTQRNRKDTLSPERIKRLDDKGFVWDAYAEAWEEGFSKLLQFKEAEGHCRVPVTFKLNGFNLGAWVSTQRSKKNSLSPERRQRLDDIGFVWDPYTEDWEEGFSKLLQFKEVEGHCRVPEVFKLDAYMLGSWVKKQRSNRDTISAERKQRLDSIAFVWDPHTETWEEGFSKLLQFKEAEGHCRVPGVFKLDAYKLGSWVIVQRTKKDSMPTERIQRLDDIGFVWDPFAEAWEKGFSKLLQFKEVHGHCRVPQGLKLDGFNLGAWVGNQRTYPDRLASEQLKRLDDIGFVWDPFTEAWEEGFSKLLKFKEAEGHCRVLRLFKLDGFNLGTWVGTQRSKKDSLSPERRQRLDEIGFVWHARKGKT